MRSSNPEIQVLIVGAGPTGLVLAVWLTRLGVRVRIVDKTAGPGTTSRALAVQARTLELYRQIGLADTSWKADGRPSPLIFGSLGEERRERYSAIWARVSVHILMR